MRTKITDGVYLNVIESNQFKTTRINVQFLAPLRAQQSGRRALLTSVLETNSADYPTQDQLSARLEEMYGASSALALRVKARCTGWGRRSAC